MASLDAGLASLDSYLNEPVRTLLSRFGSTTNGEPGNPVEQPQQGGAAAQPQPTGGDAPGGGGQGLDLSQMIQPVTDALGKLGSGQMGQPDPLQSFDGIGSALESAGNQVQQALSGLGDDWQGEAAAAAQATTRDALTQGSQVADQAATLRSSLATATAAVRDAQTRLIEIVNVFWAKIAAIGPSIIFPWGIAAAIAAAAEAVTSAAEVMAQTEGTLSAQAATVTAAAAPVDVSAVSGLQAGAQALSPLMSLASSIPSAAMPTTDRPPGAAETDAKTTAGGSSAPARAAGAPGGGSAPVRGGQAPTLTAPAARSLGAAHAATTTETMAAQGKSTAPVGSAGAPMGGAPMGHHGKAGAVSGHSAAEYLHTSDQGSAIVGDLGSVAPRVIGEKDPLDSPAPGLRIS
ncbi:hypothetical protein BCA37_24540 [Mycobacterium sp. djl-10]|nr:hypothetical protein BCA37_24540 [Mycobacterium sp. djl-10]